MRKLLDFFSGGKYDDCIVPGGLRLHSAQNAYGRIFSQTCLRITESIKPRREDMNYYAAIYQFHRLLFKKLFR